MSLLVYHTSCAKEQNFHTECATSVHIYMDFNEFDIKLCKDRGTMKSMQLLVMYSCFCYEYIVSSRKYGLTSNSKFKLFDFIYFQNK